MKHAGRLLTAASLVVCIFASAGCIAQEEVSEETVMNTIFSSIDMRLNDAAADMKLAAGQLAADNNDPELALAGLFQNASLAQSILYTNGSDLVAAAYPDVVKDAVGSNQSRYGVNASSFPDRSVRLTECLHLEDGTDNCVLIAPVYNQNREFNGSISLAFNTFRLLDSINSNIASKYGYEFYVVQEDGLQIYDPDMAEVGQNILTSSLYSTADVNAAANAICSQKSGTASYSFAGTKTDEIIRKNVFWDTYSYGGQNWRIVIY